MNYSLNVLVQLVIAFSGFVLISSGPQRNKFYSAVNLPEAYNQHATDLLLLALSISMMLILVLSSVWLKVFCIATFLYYDFLCYDILSNLGSFQAILVFAQNYFIAWLAIEGCLAASDQRAKDELKKSKISIQQNYQDEGWYPLELPVEENDLESAEHEVERIKQLVKLPANEIIKLQQKIEENIEKNETQIKNLREKQLEIHFKLIMKVLELSNNNLTGTSLPSSTGQGQTKSKEGKKKVA